jgi:Uracil DNA glycosylase superfamily
MSYDELVLARKSCQRCVGLVNPADLTHAQYDGPEVGPWSRWLASRPAKLILVGQDWGTDGYFNKHRGRDIASNKTNERIIEFLSLLGFEVGPPTETDYRSGVFTTNAILCLKRGEANQMSATVKSAWFSECRSLLKWTIEESSAPVVIALGRPAYESVTRAYGIVPRSGAFREVVETTSPIRLDAHRCLFPVFHPVARPRNRTLSQMRDDWARISGYFIGEARVTNS